LSGRTAVFPDSHLHRGRVRSEFDVPQFILVLQESLLEGPVGWKSFLLLAVLVGAVSLIIIVGLAGVGAVIGFLLWALFARRLSGPLCRPVR